MKIFNLIVAHQPGRDAYNEALRYIRAYIPQARVFYTRQSLILLRVDDPIKAVKILIDRLPPDTPILRVIPVDAVTLPRLDEVISVVRRLYPRRIPEGSTFAVRVEGRLLDERGETVGRLEAQKRIGDVVDRPVNLSKPDYLILVKVVKLDASTAYAAVSIVPPSLIYSRAKIAS